MYSSDEFRKRVLAASSSAEINEIQSSWFRRKRISSQNRQSKSQAEILAYEKQWREKVMLDFQ